MEKVGNQEDLKHVCKLCSRKFRCGKSLGGHMRSHVMAAKAHIKKSKKVVNFVVKYNNEENQDDNGVELYRDTPKQQEGDDSSLLNNSKELLNIAMEVQSDTDYINSEPQTSSSLLSHRPIFNGDSLSATENGDGSSSVHPEIDKEMKKVAKWLVELSRDSFNLVAESSDSNGSQNKTATTASNKTKIFNSKSRKAKGHKCPFCNRVFRSGQALGGHKRSHLMRGGRVGTIDKEREQTPQPLEPQPQPQPSPLQQQPQQQQRQPLLIDLNLPCTMEE
ncbi:zinc finger protein ZAT1-like [Amaranthus tricolor]|uniref:zinc finger protein ZAT1-like n=1 Tax=Amaranthus tricolor TaxID=29722 RepID=UPI0025872D0A|nr:zinc finger protein ZAT1-like [Amaranthus tricolor]